MKKIRIIILTWMILAVFVLASCGGPGEEMKISQDPSAAESGYDDGALEAEAESAKEDPAGADQTAAADSEVDYDQVVSDMKKTAIANPWGDTQSLDVAVESSGVEFTPPSEEALPVGLMLKTYRYMEGTIEAVYEGGNDSLTIRKSNDREGKDLSGDYNDYSGEWDEVISGINVHCRGNNDLINTAEYDSDNGHFAVSFNIGEEGRGISPGELQRLIDGGEEKSSGYTFRTPQLRLSHFTKHGIDMGFTSEEAYEEAASRVITNPAALHKTEAEDGDDVYYVVDTNEFVVLSTDGYIRTYFNPDKGKAYFDKQ